MVVNCSLVDRVLQLFTFGFYRPCRSIAEHHATQVVDATSHFSEELFNEIKHLTEEITYNHDAAMEQMTSASNALREKCLTVANHRFDFLSSGRASELTDADQCRIAESAMRFQIDTGNPPLKGCYDQEKELVSNFMYTKPIEKDCTSLNDSLMCSSYLREARIRLQRDDDIDTACMKPSHFELATD